MPPIEPITLRTDRLVLRPPSNDDAHAIAKLCGDFEIARTTSSIPHPYTLDHAREFIEFCRSEREAGSAANFAITLTDTGEVLGMIGLIVDAESERAELGYWIGRPFWNQGHATDAARAIVDYGFQTLALQRIHAGYFASNEASGVVQRKLGFQPEGVQRRHIVRFGEPHDLDMYALLREQWEARRDADPFRPTLRTERMLLRPLSFRDADACHEIWRHQTVADGVLSIPHPLTPEQTRERLQRILTDAPRRTGCVWAIILRGADQLIGDCGLEPDDRHLRGELGYCLHPDHWNKGYATEALAEIIRWSFEDRDPALQRLSADHYPENPASGRVLEKLGFQREGVQRGFLLKDGVRRDAVRWAKLREESSEPASAGDFGRC